MNAIFFGIIAVSFAVAGWRQALAPAGMAPGTSPMEILGLAMIDGAGGAVTLAIGLIGVMTFFLGLMKVAEAGGLLNVIAKTVRPLRITSYNVCYTKLLRGPPSPRRSSPCGQR